MVTMANSGALVKRLVEKHVNTSGVFVRLVNDGDSVVGVFCGDPYLREVVWNNGRYEDYEPDNSVHNGPSIHRAFRALMNIFVLPDERMLVMEGSRRWFRELLRVREEYDLQGWAFEVTRHGEPGDKKTKYSVVVNRPIDAQLRCRVAKAQLHDLGSASCSDGETKAARALLHQRSSEVAKTVAGRGRGSLEREFSGVGRSTYAFIDPATAANVIGRLSKLPVEDVKSILGEFGAERVRELKASDVERVQSRITEYATGIGIVNPFA
jgi:hypothetical protein